MKISVRLEVSQNTNHVSFDLSNFGLSESEWEELSDKEKHELIESAVFDLPEQPYWVLDSFSEQ